MFGLLLLPGRRLLDPELLEFASDPRIPRGRCEGVTDTRATSNTLALSAIPVRHPRHFRPLQKARAHLRAALALFGLFLIPCGVAQETLDTDLVLRLFGGLYGPTLSREDISVGELPPALARAFPLPPRTQAAGGVTYDRFSSTAVLDSQLTPARVLAFYRRIFMEQGYTPLPSDDPPQRVRQRTDRGGRHSV